MIVHRQVGLAMVAVAGLALAVYCYAGYAVAASFAVAGAEGGADRSATWYGWGMAAGLVAAAVAGVAAWRADRPH